MLNPDDGGATLLEGGGTQDIDENSTRTFLPSTPGWPAVVGYMPDPYVAGSPADYFNWVAVDSEHLLELVAQWLHEKIRHQFC